ncbi:uncharacterized protein LOC128712690 [Anopheles marshallii]|uniref:uncharacterized protein LOC128712690 n=1 Tax=Anopheles marshallii TaxID=1521116 RepID=UPI00237C4857|nr:uncharacterized protein LOC128712690 [Anopheles marshallii]
MSVDGVVLATENNHTYNRRQRRDRRWWAIELFHRREQAGNRLLDTIMAEQVSETIKTFLRMTKEDFDYLLSLIGPKIQRLDTHMRESITAQERLMITLRFLATGETFTGLQFVFRVSKLSISLIVRDVCSVLNEQLRTYVKVSACFVIYLNGNIE